MRGGGVLNPNPRDENQNVTQKEKRGDTIQMLYNNIGGQSRKLWSELSQKVQEDRWGIVALTETHWRQGNQGKELPGYRSFKAERDVLDKKGGGIAVFVKEERQVYQWEGEMRDEWELVKNENIWVVLGGGGG